MIHFIIVVYYFVIIFYVTEVSSIVCGTMQLIILKNTGLLIMPEPLLQPILIVDSDEQSVDNISSGLKANGYLVITAPDGYDGYVRAKRESQKLL